MLRLPPVARIPMRRPLWQQRDRRDAPWRHRYRDWWEPAARCRRYLLVMVWRNGRRIDDEMILNAYRIGTPDDKWCGATSDVSRIPDPIRIPISLSQISRTSQRELLCMRLLFFVSWRLTPTLIRDFLKFTRYTERACFGFKTFLSDIRNFFGTCPESPERI